MSTSISSRSDQAEHEEQRGQLGMRFAMWLINEQVTTDFQVVETIN